MIFRSIEIDMDKVTFVEASGTRPQSILRPKSCGRAEWMAFWEWAFPRERPGDEIRRIYNAG